MDQLAHHLGQITNSTLMAMHCQNSKSEHELPSDPYSQERRARQDWIRKMQHSLHYLTIAKASDWSYLVNEDIGGT